MYCYWCFVRFLLVFQFSKKFRTPFRFLGETEIKKKKKEEERKKKSLVYSPTKSFTFSVGATESELVICMEPAAVIFRFWSTLTVVFQFSKKCSSGLPVKLASRKQRDKKRKTKAIVSPPTQTFTYSVDATEKTCFIVIDQENYSCCFNENITFRDRLRSFEIRWFFCVKQRASTWCVWIMRHPDWLAKDYLPCSNI